MKSEPKFVRAMPLYLAIQAAVLVMTVLDFPVYVVNYRANHNLMITPWAGAWLGLVLFGLVLSVSVLVRKEWAKELEENTPWKVASGYLLGALTGFVTLGIRFMPVMPGGYFYFVGVLALLFMGAFVVYRIRSGQREELFP